MKKFALALTFMLAATAAHADDYTLTLKNHVFTPNELTIPANTKVKLVIKNEDASAAEFESHDLNREKVVKGGESISVFIGPLEAGTYGFEDEFHEATAQGKIIVK